jgi:pimeloyl-ACP methyl ester carboxylesterase
VEQWESNAVYLRNQLRKQIFGGFPKAPPPTAELGKAETKDGITTTSLLLQPEPGLPLPALLMQKDSSKQAQPACVILHMKGKAETRIHPLMAELLKRNWAVAAPDLRGTGETAVEGDVVAEAEDHNTAERALWIGRPMLGQWVFDVQCVLDWLALQPGLDKRRFAVVGIGAAGVIAIGAAALLEDRIASAAALGTPATYVTDQPYASIMRMGLLAPGILRLADIPQLAAMIAPRTLVVAGAVTPQDKKLYLEEIEEAYDFTQGMYGLYKPAGKLLIRQEVKVEEIAAVL